MQPLWDKKIMLSIDPIESKPRMTETKPRFGKTFGSPAFLPVFAHFFARFAQFRPLFAPLCPVFCVKMPIFALFCPVLPGFACFACLARFVWFCLNLPGLILIHLSLVCLVLGIPDLNQSIRLKIAPNGIKFAPMGPNMLL